MLRAVAEGFHLNSCLEPGSRKKMERLLECGEQWKNMQVFTFQKGRKGSSHWEGKEKRKNKDKWSLKYIINMKEEDF